MKKFLAAVIFMFGMLNSSCGAEPAVDIESARRLSASVDEFCWKYFATLNRDENIFYSPYGINAALGILANGARGDTLKEILSALEVDDVATLNDGHKNFSALAEKNYRGENIFLESNLLLIDKSVIGRGLNKNFQRVVKDVYKSDVREANFSGDSDGERKKITRWVADKTKNFIADYKSIATPATITDLLNVVYFKGKWAMPFKAKNTAAQDFTNRDGTKSTVDMMSKVFDEEIAYRADDKFKAIKLPYSENAAMYLILPAQDGKLDVAEMWHKQTPAYRAEFLDGLSKDYPFDGKVVVRLPKFELDIENDLVENLRAMGINLAFSGGAEFFDIVNDMQLKIGDAKHRAKVKVDEQGTEAAAVTEVVMVEGTAPNRRPPKIVYFLAERPFLFVIRDTQSNVTLFAGVVNSLGKQFAL